MTTTTGRQSRRAISDHQEDLRAVRARRELIAIEEVDSAVAAARDGLTQRQIAGLLGRSQSDVHRMLRRAAEGMPSETWKIILRAAAGDGTRATMVGRLRPGLNRGTSPVGEQVEGYLPGPLDDVRRAFMEGLLTEREYDEIRGAFPHNAEPGS